MSKSPDFPKNLEGKCPDNVQPPPIENKTGL